MRAGRHGRAAISEVGPRNDSPGCEGRIHAPSLGDDHQGDADDAYRPDGRAKQYRKGQWQQKTAYKEGSGRQHLQAVMDEEADGARCPPRSG